MSMRSITTKAFVAGLALMAALAPVSLFAWERHRESAAVTNDPALLNKGPIAPPAFVHPRPLVQPRPFVTRPFVHRPFVHRGPFYHWTDEQGVAHWTDRFDAIPEQYRARAKQVQPS